MRRIGALGLAMAAMIALGACSSDSKTTSSTGTTASTSSGTAPEDVHTSAAAVATGLHEIDTIAKGIAASAATDKAHAQELVEQIEPVWEDIEGTVKANDPDTYLAFEDAFALLENAAEEGDGASAQTAAATVSSTVTSYLAAYPG